MGLGNDDRDRWLLLVGVGCPAELNIKDIAVMMAIRSHVGPNGARKVLIYARELRITYSLSYILCISLHSLLERL
jgi:hypothetical protein